MTDAEWHARLDRAETVRTRGHLKSAQQVLAAMKRTGASRRARRLVELSIDDAHWRLLELRAARAGRPIPARPPRSRLLERSGVPGRVEVR